MSIHVVRLGDPRSAGEGLRLGTVRRPPRGVKKEDYARLNYYDLWLPDLAPSAELLSFAMAEPFTDARWTKFVRDYRREMKEPEKERLLQLLAALSHQTDFAVGCYCENEERCHRSVLRELLAERGASLTGT
ncbi:MAG TPA: DUF488 family protein [Thermoanaerobaculia bacterium]|nr:DUF488 family protein [Thermoanaerobaculia bacterium]